MNILATLVLAMLPQQTTPQPNYAIYGSLARQRTVYANLAQQDSERQLREYRRFREELRRQMPPWRDTSYVVREQRPIVVRVAR